MADADMATDQRGINRITSAEQHRCREQRAHIPIRDFRDLAVDAAASDIGSSIRRLPSSRPTFACDG